MRQIDRQTVKWGLEELASRKEQERLWLSDGSSGEVSSFTEVICQIFDGGVTSELDSGKIAEPIFALFRKLDALAKKIPEDDLPQEIIDHPLMTDVRAISSELLEELRSTD